MKMQTDVDGLLLLRRQSERVALDDVLRLVARLQKAERSSAEAERTVTKHVAASRATEHELIASLLGRAVSSNAIARFQIELDAMQAQTAQLESEATAARSAVAESEAKRDAASERFRLRQCDVVKLDLLARRIKDRLGRRRRAIDEAIEEDLAATGQANSAERG